MSKPPEINQTYTNLGEEFVIANSTTDFPNCQIVYLNEELANFLGFDIDWLKTTEGNKFLLGKSTNTVSMAYAGHQFGQFVPVLGDGRAHLLGEIVGKDSQLYDIQLKGSGQTAFSRRGDGKAVLAPMLKEVLIGECLHALHIPCSRALAVFTTGEMINRERQLPGAILVRVARSHIRVGTFEYFACRENISALEKLIDYSLKRLYPQVQQVNRKNSALLLLESVVKAQAKLIANWMLYGFIHGVMNTDNVNISGESFDFGPCAFMDYFNPVQVYSSIDINGRYAYNQQAEITLWNLQRLAECLLPLINSEVKTAIAQALEVLNSFKQQYEDYFYMGMRKKLNIKNTFHDEENFIAILFSLMSSAKTNDTFGADFTTTFWTIAQTHNNINHNSSENFLQLFSNDIIVSDKAKKWWADYQHILSNYGNVQNFEVEKAINPLIIARNHLVQRAIDMAQDNFDFSEFNKLLPALRQPNIYHHDFILPPKRSEMVLQTFCGT